jgi:hypothetical protein
MPGDPKECCQHALRCVRLAQTSASPQAREQFANLANTWLRLAADLEKTLSLFDEAVRRRRAHEARRVTKRARTEADAT